MAHKQNDTSYYYQATQSGYDTSYPDTAYFAGYPSSYGSSMASSGSQGSYASMGSSYGSGSTSPRFPSSKYYENSFGSTLTSPVSALSPGGSPYSNCYNTANGYNDSYISTPNPLMFRHKTLQTPYGQSAVSETSTAADMVNVDETLSLSPEYLLPLHDAPYLPDPESTFSLGPSTVNRPQTGNRYEAYTGPTQAYSSAYTYQPEGQDSVDLNSSQFRDGTAHASPERTGIRRRDTNKSTKSFPCLVEGCPSADKGAKFTRLADLQRHDKTVHNPEYQDCPHGWCGRVGKRGFTRKDHLNEHLHKFHVGQLEPPPPPRQHRR